ncbi:hypothetical protein E2C01_081373 [Portunus trituberculatus]|uniref:Uncharacterized protein n=1 Tax=Portunus trituberculatus TaxID=210409 RepID=A0A5B7IRS7_PORTR|nr:hypothetical protein [Portunus trituberculatus]
MRAEARTAMSLIVVIMANNTQVRQQHWTPLFLPVLLPLATPNPTHESRVPHWRRKNGVTYQAATDTGRETEGWKRMGWEGKGTGTVVSRNNNQY